MTPDPIFVRAAECRRAVRDYLAKRLRLAFELSAVRSAVNRTGGDWSDEEVNSALVYLAGLTPPHVKTVRDKLGPTLYYQATTGGVQAMENGD
ncbi:MAG: hypothetical protein NT105_23865 [Verrucomicrobia bacterium]|nr:hypothetical protein [Verrucomicrobiota bacterium]